MDWIKDWLLGIAAAALAVAAAQSLTPRGAVKQVTRLAGGLVLLLAVVRPVLALEPGDLPVLALPGAAGTETVENRGGEVLKRLIAQKTGAYILDKGRALGCEITQARVTAAEDGSGWPVPWSAEVTGTWTPEQQRALARAVEDELGIPAQRQSYREEGT